LGVSQFALFGKLVVPNGSFEQVVGFVLAAYFIGLGVGELGLPLKQVGLPERCQGKRLVLQQKLAEHFRPSVLNRHERTVFFVHVGVSVGIAGILTALMLLARAVITGPEANWPEGTYWILTTCSAVYGVWMLVYGQVKKKHAEDELRTMAEELG
jgi:hypothetical protein